MEQQSHGKSWMLLFGIIMVLVYLGMGVMLAVFNVFNISKTFSIVIGILFFIYGVFRGVRLYKSKY